MQNCSRQVVDEKIDVALLGRAALDFPSPPVDPPLGKRVAIIGGGPGGMNAAGSLPTAELRPISLKRMTNLAVKWPR